MVAEEFKQSSPRTILRYDNLIHDMRLIYYRLQRAGMQPTKITASLDTMIGYEDIVVKYDPPVTTFKGLPMSMDPDLPVGTLKFWLGGVVVGELSDIS